MERLNFQHLLYFWTVAREGSIARARQRLHLTQPTISTQLRLLERSMGAKLFERAGRSLVLTDTGRMVFRYADEIFSLGRELRQAVEGNLPGQSIQVVIGVADVLPRAIVFRLLQPILRLPQTVRVVCHDDRAEALLARLAVNELDLVLSDVPANPFFKIRAHNHLLDECSVSIMGSARMAARFRKGFPRSLDGAPFLLPMQGTSLRRLLDGWFESIQVHPLVRGEFADCDLFEEFGRAEAGLFAVPTLLQDTVRKQHHLRTLGRIESIREQFFAITGERKLMHPAVVAITAASKPRAWSAGGPQLVGQ
jgi:LysR family transcriptional activator of nhaA